MTTVANLMGRALRSFTGMVLPGSNKDRGIQRLEEALERVGTYVKRAWWFNGFTVVSGSLVKIHVKPIAPGDQVTWSDVDHAAVDLATRLEYGEGIRVRVAVIEGQEESHAPN